MIQENITWPTDRYISLKVPGREILLKLCKFMIFLFGMSIRKTEASIFMFVHVLTIKLKLEGTKKYN